MSKFVTDTLAKILQNIFAYSYVSEQFFFHFSTPFSGRVRWKCKFFDVLHFKTYNTILVPASHNLRLWDWMWIIQKAHSILKVLDMSSPTNF